MSHILFDDQEYHHVISGAERANMGSILRRLAGVTGYLDTSDDVAFGTMLDAATAADPEVMLLARLHGQCEIHCYVEGRNRKWLSMLIYRALRRTVRLPLEGGGGTGSVDMLRGGMSMHETIPPLPTRAEFEAGTDRRWSPVSGWYDLCIWLKGNEKIPAVCSYSVTDTFPGMDDGRPIPWDDGLAQLRERADILELRPEGWADYRFRR